MEFDKQAVNKAALNSAGEPWFVGTSTAALPSLGGSIAAIAILTIMSTSGVTLSGSASAVHGEAITSNAALSTLDGSAQGYSYPVLITSTTNKALSALGGSASGVHGIGATSNKVVSAFTGSSAAAVSAPPAITFTVNTAYPVTGSATAAIPVVSTSIVATNALGGSIAGYIVPVANSYQALPVLSGSIVGKVVLAPNTCISVTALPVLSGSAAGTSRAPNTFTSTVALPPIAGNINATSSTGGVVWRNVNIDTKLVSDGTYNPVTNAAETPGETFRRKFRAVYSAQQKLTSAIDNAIKHYADDAWKDGILTPAEKKAISAKWAEVTGNVVARFGTPACDTWANVPVGSRLRLVYDQAILLKIIVAGWTQIGEDVAILRQYLIDLKIWSDPDNSYTMTDAQKTNYVPYWASVESDLAYLEKMIAQKPIDNIGDMGNDNKLTPSEKIYLRLQWNLIYNEYLPLFTKAGDYTGTATALSAYTVAMNALGSYMNQEVSWTYPGLVPSIINDTTSDGMAYTTDLNYIEPPATTGGGTLRLHWENYYKAKTTLETAISLGGKATDLPIDTLSKSEKAQCLQDFTALAARWDGYVNRGEPAMAAASWQLFADACNSTTLLPDDGPTPYEAKGLTMYLHGRALISPEIDLSVTTALGTGNRVRRYNQRWLTALTAENNFVAAITSAKFVLNTADMATKAMEKADLAMLTAPISVGWNWADRNSYLSTYAGGTVVLTADGHELQLTQSTPHAWKEITVAATVLAGQIFTKQLTVANWDNLIPNPNSELGRTGTDPYAAENRYVDGGWGGDNGTQYCRYMSCSAWLQYPNWMAGNPQYSASDAVPCVPGEQFYFKARIKTVNARQGVVTLWVAFYSDIVGSFGSFISGTSADFPPTSYYIDASVGNAAVGSGAPSNAKSMRFVVVANSLNSDAGVCIDNMYGRRMNDANVIVDGTLTANKFAAGELSVNDIYSNYWSGSNGSSASYTHGPTGLHISKSPFTTQFLHVPGGTYDYSTNCYMELPGDANFGGYKVATVIDKAFNSVISTAAGASSGVSDTALSGCGLLIVPKSATRLMICFTGSMVASGMDQYNNPVAAAGTGSGGIYYGIGNAPAAGSTAGTKCANIVVSGSCSSTVFIQVIPGTQYWLDFAGKGTYLAGYVDSYAGIVPMYATCGLAGSLYVTEF